MAAPFGAGLVTALGQAPVSLPLVALVALAVLFWLFNRAETPLRAALIGWAGGTGAFVGGMFWIVEPFLVDPWRYGWMAPFALFLLPGGLALFWALAFGLAGKVAPGMRRLLMLAALLAMAETARAFVLTGFPWGLVGYVWIGSPVMQAASVIGPHGLTLATTLAAGLLAIGAGSLAGSLAGSPRRHLAVRVLAPALAVAMIVAGWDWGLARLAEPAPESRGLSVRIVQPNADQGLKWDPALAQGFLQRLLTYTAEYPEGPAPDLVVWPETAVQYLLNGSESLLRAIDLASSRRPVVFGIMREEAGLYYNSLVVTRPGGSIGTIYDKAHLTPFGEYMPFGDLLARFGIYGLAASAGAGFSAGDGPRLVEAGKVGRILPLICYEAIFPQALFMAERADLIVQITNDAWFGKVSGPYQHLAQARLRAVEQGLPMARAANTGISAMIDAKGRVTASLPLGTQGMLDAALPPALPRTPYARLGDWPALLAMLLLAAGLAMVPVRKPD